MRSLAVAPLLLLLVACDRGGRETQHPPPAPCDCPCPNAAPVGAGAAPGVSPGGWPGSGPAPGSVGAAGAPVDPGPQDARGLMSSATRKMNHGDGLGCLQDLDLLVAADPRQAEHLATIRGQCEMLSGRCQEGKQRIDAYMAYQHNTPPEQRQRMVEALASMHCRGGNMSDRDRLLAANQKLVQGAYMQQLSPAECAAAHQTARALMHKVPPRGPDDTLITNLPKSLYHTAANCFARAGDCKSARRVFEQDYPAEHLAKIKDAKARQQILDTTFNSVVSRCKP